MLDAFALAAATRPAAFRLVPLGRALVGCSGALLGEGKQLFFVEAGDGGGTAWRCRRSRVPGSTVVEWPVSRILNALSTVVGSKPSSGVPSTPSSAAAMIARPTTM